jgi:hypothetical protein
MFFTELLEGYPTNKPFVSLDKIRILEFYPHGKWASLEYNQSCELHLSTLMK